MRAVAAVLLTAAVGTAHAQGLAESMRAGWQTYIFVATTLPRATLNDLAREALQAHATLVLRGFSSGTAIDLQSMQTFVGSVNASCCDKGKPPHWIVDPRLYDRFHVTAVPAFVVSNGGSAEPNSFSLVAGDMALANALKFIAQRSALEPVRARASALYQSTFASE